MNKNALTKAAKEAAALVERNKETDYDALEDYYYRNKDRQLTAHQEAVRERWLKAYGLWLRGESQMDISDILVKDYLISESTAFRDVPLAIKLWSQYEDNLTKKVKRIQVKAMIKETRKAAIEEANWKVVATCEKNLIMVDGLQNEDVDMPFDKMELLPAVNVLDAASRTFVDMLLKAVVSTGSINLMNLNEHSGISITDISNQMARDAEDVEYEEYDVIEGEGGNNEP